MQKLSTHSMRPYKECPYVLEQIMLEGSKYNQCFQDGRDIEYHLGDRWHHLHLNCFWLSIEKWRQDLKDECF